MKWTILSLIIEFACIQLCLCQLKQYVLEEGDVFRFACEATVSPLQLRFDPIFFAVSKGDQMSGIAVNAVLINNGEGFKVDFFTRGPENKTIVLEISKRVFLRDSGNYTCGTKASYHQTVNLKVKKGDLGHVSLTIQKLGITNEPVGRPLRVTRNPFVADPPRKVINVNSGTYRVVCDARRKDLNLTYVIIKNGMKVGNTSTTDLALVSSDTSVACRVKTRGQFRDAHTLGFSTIVRDQAAPNVTCQPGWTNGHRECIVSGVTCDDIEFDSMSSSNKTPKGGDVIMLSCETDISSDVVSSILQISETDEESFFIKVRSNNEDSRYEIRSETARYSFYTSAASSSSVKQYSLAYKTLLAVLVAIPVVAAFDYFVL